MPHSLLRGRSSPPGRSASVWLPGTHPIGRQRPRSHPPPEPGRRRTRWNWQSLRFGTLHHGAYIHTSTLSVWETDRFESLLEQFPLLHRNVTHVLERQLNELEIRFREVSIDKVSPRLRSLIAPAQPGPKAVRLPCRNRSFPARPLSINRHHRCSPSAASAANGKRKESSARDAKPCGFVIFLH
jgi:hypothetical protein